MGGRHSAREMGVLVRKTNDATHGAQQWRSALGTSWLVAGSSADQRGSGETPKSLACSINKTTNKVAAIATRHRPISPTASI